MKLEIRLLCSPSRQDNRCSFCCLLVLFLPARLTWQETLIPRTGRQPALKIGVLAENKWKIPFYHLSLASVVATSDGLHGQRGGTRGGPVRAGPRRASSAGKPNRFRESHSGTTRARSPHYSRLQSLGHWPGDGTAGELKRQPPCAPCHRLPPPPPCLPPLRRGSVAS